MFTSSIEHGGMSTVFCMVEQFDSMRVRDHFPICRNFCVGIFFGIFCLTFCLTILWYFCVGLLVVGGGLIWFPLHMTMVWYLVIGSGNPGTE